MKLFDINLELDYEKWNLGGGHRASMTCYLPSNFEEFSNGRLRPAVVVCPGGGYGMRSSREGEPISLQYVAQDMASFVLHYSVGADAGYPRCALEALTTIKTIRDHAAEWNIDPDQIAIVGFSAGGHLAASVGAFWNSGFAAEVFGDCTLCKPNAAILCYPVITSGPHAHRGSFVKLIGEDAPREQFDLLSIEKQVTADYPPTFLWHTATDSLVPVQNTILMANALAEVAVPFEVHIYPNGVHGLALSDERTMGCKNGTPNLTHLEERARPWVADSVSFLRGTAFKK